LRGTELGEIAFPHFDLIWFPFINPHELHDDKSSAKEMSVVIAGNLKNTGIEMIKSDGFRKLTQFRQNIGRTLFYFKRGKK